jgi:hypothetical protein
MNPTISNTGTFRKTTPKCCGVDLALPWTQTRMASYAADFRRFDMHRNAHAQQEHANEGMKGYGEAVCAGVC